MSTVEHLVIAAFPPELDPSCALFANSEIEFALCGVGMVDAAANTTALILKHQPKHVLFIGSAGSVSRDLPLLTFAAAVRVALADSAISRNDAYAPSLMASDYTADKAFLSRIMALSSKPHSGTFYSPLGISANATQTQEYEKRFGPAFENLELFGVATACQNQSVPWNALSCVTNFVGSEGQAEWKRNYEVAGKHTSRVVKELLSGRT